MLRDVYSHARRDLPASSKMISTRGGRARDRLRQVFWLVCIVGTTGCPNSCRSSLIFGKEQFCDPAKELTFLEVGDVEGRWYRVDENGKKEFNFRFDSQGHFRSSFFGCKKKRWPLVDGGVNSWGSYMGYGWKSLEGYEIRPGYFRLDFLTQGDEECLEGKLMPDGTLHMKSAEDMMINGVYFKTDKLDDEEESSTSGADGSDDSLTGSGGSSTPLDSATTTQSGS